ncbi:MAG: hypothetical protein HYT88_03985 [Candidatus Omnitrophica bacterium]|nr:hypothetical protein [Candidatus Omnitrophota bacterium]MBI2173945.1 hypothetical protein [Candidatus Omnitrophota bacterium]MBI3010371.1 hypothetical protein [Candidatus Omnitrophota bacterium]
MTRKILLVLAIGGLLLPAGYVSSQVAGISKIVGSITTMDLKAQPPTLKLTDEKGKQITVTLDPKKTKVLQDGRSAKLEELKVGQRVEVDHSAENGKQIAQKINVVSSASATPTMPGGSDIQSPGSSSLQTPAENAPAPRSPADSMQRSPGTSTEPTESPRQPSQRP